MPGGETPSERTAMTRSENEPHRCDRASRRAGTRRLWHVPSRAPTPRTADVSVGGRSSNRVTNSRTADRSPLNYEVSAPAATVLAPSCDSAGQCALPYTNVTATTHGRHRRHRGGRGIRGHRHRLRELGRKRDRHRNDRAMRLRNVRRPVLHRLRPPRCRRRRARHVADRARPRHRRPRVAHRERHLHRHADQP